ncbi:hypothetical protein XENOCAPTIV_003973 [Xenoophorus captivus]|uniref:Uncharacterized protein n=1 Tax=Xenoophorus captivus TaxID=1517983 RepID=A0ABV0RZG4_9TELE
MKISDTQTVFRSYLTLHMIDDRMTEFMCFCQQRDISALCSPPMPMITGGRDRLVGEGQEINSYCKVSLSLCLLGGGRWTARGIRDVGSENTTLEQFCEGRSLRALIQNCVMRVD